MSGESEDALNFNLSGTQINSFSGPNKHADLTSTPRMSSVSTNKNSHYLMRGPPGKKAGSLSVQDGENHQPDTTLFVGTASTNVQDLSSNPPAAFNTSLGRGSGQLGTTLQQRRANARARDNSHVPDAPGGFGVAGSQLGPSGQRKQASLLENEDYLHRQQERFNELMRNKKAKESIRKFDKERRMEKARSMQKNQEAPINKYYREQVGQLGQASGSDLALPSISGTQLGSGPGGAQSTTLTVGLGQEAPRNGLSLLNQDSATGSRGQRSEPKRNGSMKRLSRPGQPTRLNVVPGRMRGNDTQYRNFVGDLQADLSGFDVNGTSLQQSNNRAQR